MLKLEREVTIAGVRTSSTQYAITSLSQEEADAQTLLSMWRSRWEVESTFWVRDVTFREDHSRIRTGLAPQNMSIIRNAAMNYLKTTGSNNFAKSLRKHALKVPELISNLGILNN